MFCQDEQPCAWWMDFCDGKCKESDMMLLLKDK